MEIPLCGREIIISCEGDTTSLKGDTIIVQPVLQGQRKFIIHY